VLALIGITRRSGQGDEAQQKQDGDTRHGILSRISPENAVPRVPCP
jgi:hypothetical protein